MENQENCVTIVNNVIAKIKKISSDLGGDGNNEDINKLDELVGKLISDQEAELKGKDTENGKLTSQINELEKKLKAETDKAKKCEDDLSKLKAENLAAQADRQKEMEKLVEETNSKINSKSQELKDANERNDKAKRKQDEMAAETARLQEELQLKQQDVETAKTKSEEDKITAASNLQKALDDYNRKLEEKDNADKVAKDALILAHDKALAQIVAQRDDYLKKLNISNDLNALKDGQINAQNSQLSRKDDELFAMKEKNLELMKQYYGKHLAFKEIFTELNNKVTKTKESAQSTKLESIEEPPLSKELIKKRIVDKQKGVIVEYSTKQLNSLRDIKERINAINKRIQVLKEAKTSEPQTKEATAGGGGDNQEELNKIDKITDLKELQEMLGVAEEEFNNLNNNNDIDLLKPDQQDQPDQSEYLNELTKQHWISKDDYGDITEFANKMIEMYNYSVEKLNGSIAENEDLNKKFANLQESGEATEKSQAGIIAVKDKELEDLKLEIKVLNGKIESGEKEFQAILDLLTNSNNDASTNFNDTTELIFEENVDDDDGLPMIKDNYKIDDKQKTLLELLKNENTNLEKEKKGYNDSINKEFPLPFQEQTQPIKIAIYDKLLDLNNNQRRMMRLAILSKEQQEDLKNKDANIDNFKGNIPTLLKNLTNYDPNQYTTIPTIEGQDYNGIMAQIYESLLANYENLYISTNTEDMTILSDVKEEDGVLIKLYKEKLNLENILDMIKKKFEDYKDNNNKQEYGNIGYLEKFTKFKEEKTNYSYKGYNLQAATIASNILADDNNEKKIPVEEFFIDMIYKLEENTEAMEEMKKKVDDFLKEKQQNDETKESELKGKIAMLEAKTTTNETNLEKFKKLQMNFMKFKKYIDSTNLNLTNLLKNKIDAIHRDEDAKAIFPKDQHRLLIKYDTETEPEAIDSQIAKMTTSIITNLLTSNDGTQYIKNEGGGENTSDTNSTSLVIDDLSNLSQSISDGGYSKNKIKMNSISHKKRKRSIKKYK